jgi:hypothetical protein
MSQIRCDAVLFEGLDSARQQNWLLDRLAAGHTNTQIARRLGLSEGTLRTHLENIYSRLQVSSPKPQSPAPSRTGIHALVLPPGHKPARGECPPCTGGLGGNRLAWFSRSTPAASARHGAALGWPP